jgi:hypothetical protein
MHKSFQIIDDFVRELYGFNIVTGPIHGISWKIKELKKAHDIILRLNKSKSNPLPNDFIKFIYPLLEVSFQWTEIKKESHFKEFIETCKKRVGKQTDFYGTTFEIDMASRCLLSDWNIKYVEDYSKEGKQIDFLFYQGSIHDKLVGVECTSKRSSVDALTIDKINKTIKKKAKKFKPEYIRELCIPLDERLLIIDITTENYSSPKILEDLDKTQVANPLDGVIFTWKEDIINGDNHSLLTKYATVGNIKKDYFSATYAAEIHKSHDGFVFFIRKYIEPEPMWG